MTNIEIIKQLQEQYKDIDRGVLIAYINELIKTEYLRYNDNELYFDDHFESILLGNQAPSTELDFAIAEAIFITLQPLRSDIDSKNIEQVLLSWSGYILDKDISKDEYPTNIIHYFDDEEDEELDFMSMSREKLKEAMEYNAMVSCDKKPRCAKVLSDKINRVMFGQTTMEDEEFDINTTLINYRFLRIHPFHDGNGRVSRMLLNYMLNKRDGYFPIALNNDEIKELIGHYKQTSKWFYTVFMGFYLSNLEYDDEGSYELETEESFIGNASQYLKGKQDIARKMLGIGKPVEIKKKQL